MEDNKEADSVKEGKKANLTERVRENPWMLSSLILGVLAVALLIVNFSGGITGNVISGDSAADNLIKYLNDVADSEVKLVDVASEGSNMYKVTVEYGGQDIDVYMTKDGGYYTPNLLPITSDVQEAGEQSQAQDVPKTEKPGVELYVFTYCPYGLQMEKAVLPVVELLGDKINFRIRQIGAMHGEYEKIEAERQLCIEKLYPDKFLDYVLAFAEDTSIGSCNGDAACLAPKLKSLYSKFGMSESAINSCMTSEGETLYNAEVQNANTKGVSGSPTLIINGVEASASRSPEGVKGVVCDSFSSVASECSQTLSTSQTSAGFGSATSTGSGSSTASCL